VIVNSVISSNSTQVISPNSNNFNITNLTNPSVRPSIVAVWSKNFANSTQNKYVTNFSGSGMQFEQDTNGTGLLKFTNMTTSNMGVVSYTSTSTETLVSTLYLYYL
jgi:hypothetical protein